jgi:hypothetical protein
MGDIFQTHVLRGLRGECRTPAASAEEDESLRFGKHRLGVGAFRVDPEFEHSSGAGKGTWYLAFALDLPGVAEINENHIGFAQKLGGLSGGKCLNFSIRFRKELLVAFF